jgi:hypothetical protein
MKRTGLKNKQELKLKRRLELVRNTIRELTPTELERVNGGNEEPGEEACPLIWRTYVTTL